MEVIDSASESLLGILDTPPSPLRYQYFAVEPLEVTGMLGARVKRGSHVLEVGCGTGALLSVFRDQCGASVVGVEPDAARVNMAREQNFDVLHGYYDSSTSEALGKFDTIVFADVLEHIADPAPVLLLARQNLRPGGCVIASVPNVAHWTVRLSLLRGRFDYQPTGLLDATHLRWYTISSMRRLFRATGFEIVDMDWTSAQWLSAYARLPFGIPGTERKRRKFVRWLVKSKPGLFGFQHIVVARPSA